MFEAVALICLELANGACRDQLVPGYEAIDRAGCEALLTANPPGTEARCLPVGEVLEVVEVAEGVFVHGGLIEEPDKLNRGDVANLGFIIGEASVAVIDTGAARWMGEALWRAVRARTDKPVSHVILTHMHPDHVFGAGPFVEAGASVVGHARLQRDLADRAGNYLESLERLLGSEAFLGTATAEVLITVEDKAVLDLGNRVLELTAWPPAHTGTDLTVFDRATETLFAGDLVFDRHTPALDGKLTGWRRVLADLKAIEAARVVPGHGAEAIDWPAGAGALERYLAVLEADTRAAIDRGARIGEAVETIAAGEAALWDLFPEYNPRNATVAFTELEWE